MQIGDVIIEGPAEEIMVLPCGGQDIVFRARTVVTRDYEDFDKLCPRPTPPEIIRKGGERVLDINDDKFNKALDLWAGNKTSWIVLKSLEPSRIVWTTVKMEDPETWKNYRKELEDTFGDIATDRIISLCYTACGLNNAKIEEATKRFLASRDQAAGKQ